MTNENFLDLKQDIIESFIELNNDYFMDNGEYLWTEDIERLRNTDNIIELATILEELEYWDAGDMLRIALLYNN